ncbi:unnamed protein product [Mucor hiemalis]
MPWKLVEFIWRRKHHGNIFGGMMTTLREVVLGRERGDAEWTQYIPYTERAVDQNAVEEEEEEEQVTDDADEEGEIVEVDEVPFEVFPFRRSTYNLRQQQRRVRSRHN